MSKDIVTFRSKRSNKYFLMQLHDEHAEGGGHNGAAGGIMDEEEFIRLITKKEM